MTVLKARVAGAWQTIGSGFGPAGGVAGDFLTKNSATDFDAVWGTSAPLLNLTSMNVVTLASTNHPLTIGTVGSTNLGAYSTGIQARSNGAIAILRLNYYGGDVIIGGGNNAQYPGGLYVDESAATSNRAQIQLGSGWQIGQDLQANGTKDFYLYNSPNARTALAISADGLAVTLAGSIRVGGGSGSIFEHTSECHIGTPTIPFTVTASRINVLNAAGNTWYFNHDGTRFWTPNPIVSDNNITAGGSISASGNVTSTGSGEFRTAGAMYASNWFRTYGNTGLYSETHGAGIQAIASGYMTMYGASLALADYTLYLRAWSDSSHFLRFNNTYPSGSGEANNGPLLAGYTGVWLYCNNGGAQFYLSQGGNVFINAGKAYTVFSSREHKENITPLDPEKSLDMVRRWQPVEFDLKADGKHAEGFISEEHVNITPSMCNICNDDSIRPGWANAVDYAGGVVHLAGAVQVLLQRIEELEKKVA